MSDDASGTSFAIEDVRVFDGEAVIESTSVSVEDGVIAAVGDRRPGLRAIDGSGCTLLPGLIDSHLHAWGSLERVLGRYLLFGVTTVFEMQCDGDGLAEAHALRESDPPHIAQMWSSGFPVTVPGGHGTEFGFAVPTVSSADEVDAFVEARVDEGAAYIKLMYNDARFSRRTVSEEIVAATVKAAHGRGLKVAAHISTLRTAIGAIEHGADILAHVHADGIDPDIGELARSKGVSVIPTLAVTDANLRTFDPESPPRTLVDDARIAPFLTSFDRRFLASDPNALRASVGLVRRPAVSQRRSIEKALRATRQMIDAGVPILAGSDAPNPGTAHGATLHRELELLVEAGMTPVQALAAATSVPASCFGLSDRGRITPGLRADLLLVRGDPTIDITATRDIVSVWKAGHLLERVTR